MDYVIVRDMMIPGMKWRYEISRDMRAIDPGNIFQHIRTYINYPN